MTMNISEVLANTLSPVQQVRDHATETLEQLARESFPNFLLVLCQELSNQQSAPHIRKAAGICLKNAFSAKESHRLEEYSERWLSMDVNNRSHIKSIVIQALGSSDAGTGTVAGQIISAMAAIELPRGEWPDLIAILLNEIRNAKTSLLKQMTLQAIGFICESIEPEVLTAQANDILNAIAHGAQKDETNVSVRLAAIQALQNCLEFIKDNFEREGERNYIMQIVCEATQSTDSSIQVAAFECLCKIMYVYYDSMDFYMTKALYGITLLGMRHENDQVILQAIEFWSTICEIEYEILLEEEECKEINEICDKVNHHFALKAVKDLVEPLLWLLAKQEDEEEEDEWNVSMAAATCLSSLALCVQSNIVEHVLPFIELHIQSQDWRFRDASVMAFGSIMEGPYPETLGPLVSMALPVLLNLTKDPSVHVKDSAAWTIGRISEVLSTQLSPEQLQSLIAAILPGLNDKPRVASNCAWCFINLAEQLGADDQDTGALSPYFETIITALNNAAEMPMQDPNFKASAYEAIATMATNSPRDCLPIISNLAIHMLDRLEKSIAMQSQILPGDDMRHHNDFQANLCSVLTSVIRKLGKEIIPLSDRIMGAVLSIMTTASKGSTVMEDAFLVVGAITAAVEADFIRYIESFLPFLYAALQNHEDHQMCSISIGIVGDMCRALNEGISPYCDNTMNILIQNLMNPLVHRTIKPACLSAFGDIALAIGGKFEVYLNTVMGNLSQVAAGIVSDVDPSNYELIDLYYMLKEGIVEAYVGIIQGLKTGGKAQLLTQFIQPMFSLAEQIASDQERPESLTRCLVGMLGDLAEAFPPGHLKPMFSVHWVDIFLKGIKTDRTLSINTKEVGKWTREMVRRQISV